MNQEIFRDLDAGDIIMSELTGICYTVMVNYGRRVTAVRTADVTNPSEWKLVNKVRSRENLVDEGFGTIDHS